jgi:hypothetical protein
MCQRRHHPFFALSFIKKSQPTWWTFDLNSRYKICKELILLKESFLETFLNQIFSKLWTSKNNVTLTNSSLVFYNLENNWKNITKKCINNVPFDSSRDFFYHDWGRFSKWIVKKKFFIVVDKIFFNLKLEVTNEYFSAAPLIK